MRYTQTETGIFLSRPNRFLAQVMLNGTEETCHVKNTGRCRELLLPGTRVVVSGSDNPARRTRYDLIAVYKGERLINMDSQAPNHVMAEWLRGGGLFSEVTKLQPECRYGSSRFDFYLEADGQKIFAEVKGVTLEQDGVVLFPDAPTDRGVKHVYELIDAAQNGYGAYLFFVIQMERCAYFTPNRTMHAAFADALEEAKRAGVHLIALNCRVEKDFLAIDGRVPIRLHAE